MIENGNSEMISVEYLYAYKQTSLEQVIFLHSVVQYTQQIRLLSYDSANHYCCNKKILRTTLEY